MPRPIHSAELLESADEDVRRAAAVVLEHIQEHKQGVSWSDVSSRISRDQWEALIQSNILEKSATGYCFSDRRRVWTDLQCDQAARIGQHTPEQWTILDKCAGVITLVLYATFSSTAVRSAVGTTLNTVLDPLNRHLSFWAVLLLLSVVTGLYSHTVFVMRSSTDSAFDTSLWKILSFRPLLDRSRELRNANDAATLDRIEQEQRQELKAEAKAVSTYLTVKLRVTIWVLLVGFPVLEWIYWMVQSNAVGYLSPVIFPITGQVAWSYGLLGVVPVWLVWYGLCSYLVAKLLDILSGVLSDSAPFQPRRESS